MKWIISSKFNIRQGDQMLFPLNNKNGVNLINGINTYLIKHKDISFELEIYPQQNAYAMHLLLRQIEKSWRPYFGNELH